MSYVPQPRRVIGVAPAPFHNMPSIVRAARTYQETARTIAAQMIPNFAPEDLENAVKDMLTKSILAAPSRAYAACHVLAYNQHLIEGLPLTEEALLESVQGFEQALRDRESPWMKWLPAMAADLIRYAHMVRSRNV